MSSITHSSVEHLVRRLPDDKLPDAYRYLSKLATEADSSTAHEDFMRLPLSERRRLMEIQARGLVTHYEETADEREEWQSGDVRDDD